MRCVAGAIHRPGEGLAPGWLLLDGGVIVDEGDGRPPQPPDATGLILPSPVNAHTHVGDRVGRGRDLRGMSLADVVKPPYGLKHKLLRETPGALLVDGMRAAIAEMRAAGCRAFVDFREGGLEGVRQLREADDGVVRGIALARPQAGWDDEEARAVARAADGIGLSGLGDVGSDVPRRAADAARHESKRFALHFSEERREDVGRALDLRPDFLVHVVASPKEDLAAIAEAGVPVVLCPRSNALFGNAPPAREMLELGIELALGSDNAMFHGMDVLDDVRHLAAAHPDVARHVWLDVAIAGGARIVDGEAPRAWLRKGHAADLVVLAGDDLDAVFGAAPPRVLALGR